MYKRDLIGKILFVLSIIGFIYMFITPIANILIHVDEYWTLSLINLPLIEGMKVAINDVHPPLYYLMLYPILWILKMANVGNMIYALKIVSIIPYFAILCLSYFKLKDEYNWLTAGLFAFAIVVMGDFFIQFLTLRMYSWGLLFLLLSFVYYREVLTKNDRKSWMLLTLFTLLSAYTHYFLILTSGLIYILLLIHMIRNNLKVKQWIYSVISLAILYLPWLLVLLRQLNTQNHTTYPGSMGSADIFNYLIFYSIKSTDLTVGWIAIKILALAFVVLIVFMIFKKKTDDEGLFELSGIFLFYGTIAIGVIILAISFKPLQARYLVPVSAIFWLAASIVIGKIENSKILAVLLVCVLVLSAGSVFLTSSDITDRISDDSQRSAFLDNINNNDTVVVYNTNFGYMFVHDDLNNTLEYSLSDTYFFDEKVKISKDINMIIKKNPDKDIYLVNWDGASKNKLKFDGKVSQTESYNSGDVIFLKLDKK